jgi:acylphosphatase
MEHYKISVKGKVQGVFYRASTRKIALELNIKGFVRNEDNGDVYIEAEADATALEKFLDWCRKGPDRARVEQVHHKPGELQHFTVFEIR